MRTKFIDTVPLGAEVSGLDVSNTLSGDVIDQLRRLIHDRAVVTLRGQNLTPRQQVDFGRYFGAPEEHLLTQYLLPGHPELLVVSNIIENGSPIGIVDAGSSWHTDMSYARQPTYLSMLYAVEVPHAVEGGALGDTSFVNTAFAYDTLSPELKATLKGKNAVHSYLSRSNARHTAGSKRKPPTQEQIDKVKDIEHPIFRQHPFCEKTCIFVDRAYTISIPGMDKAESERHLNLLFDHLIRPDFIYRHKWQAGDLVIWDNTQTQHIAHFDYAPEQHRRMHRVSLRGTQPYGTS